MEKKFWDDNSSSFITNMIFIEWLCACVCVWVVGIIHSGTRNIVNGG